MRIRKNDFLVLFLFASGIIFQYKIELLILKLIIAAVSFTDYNNLIINNFRILFLIFHIIISILIFGNKLLIFNRLKKYISSRSEIIFKVFILLYTLLSLIFSILFFKDFIILPTRSITGFAKAGYILYINLGADPMNFVNISSFFIAIIYPILVLYFLLLKKSVN